MTAQFKSTCVLPIALAVGNEVGNIISMSDTVCEVTFPIYGANFSLGISNFVITNGEAPLDIRPLKPTPDSTWDGSKWVAPTALQLTASQQKKLGLPFNGFIIPLTRDSQDIIVALTLAFQLGAITTTKIEFENGVIMPVGASDFMTFARWFVAERSKFFV